MKKRSSTGGNVNWHSYYGKQCGGSLEKLKIDLLYDPQYLSWTYIWRKPQLEKTRAPRCSYDHYLQYLRRVSNLRVHGQMHG